MPRVKGTSQRGSVRALRLPLALDAWFEQRLRDEPDRSATQLLLEIIHAGLRLRRGYFAQHVERLAFLHRCGDAGRINAYVQALTDTFGDAYVSHVHAVLTEATPGTKRVEVARSRKLNSSCAVPDRTRGCVFYGP